MIGAIIPEVRAALAGPLLDWYRIHKRDLPWRRRQDDPYAVWVSEIMLQQTQVATVIPYYERWMSRFPTLGSLAGAPIDDVMKLWAGLGYYARARNLHRAAKIVVERHGACVPDDPDAIRRLPGIGRYTAGAILSIAFNRMAPILDGNVIRLLSRVFAIDGDPKSSHNQTALWRMAEDLIPDGEAREFNQALMELGALVCKPSDPACERCPLLAICRAGNSPDPTAWPQLPKGRSTVRAAHAALILRREDRVLLVKRPEHGLWGGLWEFPRLECEPQESPENCAARAAQEVVGVTAEVGERLAKIKHTVMHYGITLHGFEGTIVCGDPVAGNCAELRWVTPSNLHDFPVSSPQKAMVEAVIARLGSRS